MLELEHMLILGGLRSVRVTDLLRDVVLHCVPVDCPWLLYHARAALGVGTA